MKLYIWFKNAINNLFSPKGAASYSARTGRGIDSGRDTFTHLKDSEGKKKRNLLRKLNSYRTRKKNSGQPSFKSPKKSHHWGRRILLVFCFLLAAGLFITSSGGTTVKAFLADLDYFNIGEIGVSGCLQTSITQVRTESGISINSSLLFLDSKHIEGLVASKLSWIKSVDIIKEWPDKVLISVKEYEPHALVLNLVDDTPQLFYMDREGDPFVRAEVGMDLDFPIITGLDNIADQAVKEKRLGEVLLFLKLIRANNPNLPAQSVSEIHIDEQEGLVIHMVEYPFPVFFGSGDVREKYIRLRKVLEVLYKPRKKGMEIAQVTYIRMDYLDDKVIVGYSESG